MAPVTIKPGIGIYSRPEAARLLGMTPSRLRRWVSGYTYWLRYDRSDARQRRSRPPVIATDLPVIDSFIALSFLELMELRVVKALVDKGVSLQHVRAAARLASEHFRTDHPFASCRVFTDGSSIFSAMSSEEASPDVVKWQRAEIEQLVAGGIFESFLQEIQFDPETSLAYRWWPLGQSRPVVLDPRISFGAPIIDGTAVRTVTVARMAAHLSVNEAAVAYELERRQVEAAVEFEAQLAAA
jgi:uncharacterized protein (DUF433 family)/DNA-binding transcriptional MerR regulator